jgi:hypothetical protein
MGNILRYQQLQQPDLFEVDNLELKSSTSCFISLDLVKEKIPCPNDDCEAQMAFRECSSQAYAYRAF